MRPDDPRLLQGRHLPTLKRSEVRFIGMDWRYYEGGGESQEDQRLSDLPSDDAISFFARCLAKGVSLKAYRTGSAPPFGAHMLKPVVESKMRALSLAYPTRGLSSHYQYSDLVDEQLGILITEALAYQDKDEDKRAERLIIIIHPNTTRFTARGLAALREACRESGNITLIEVTNEKPLSTALQEASTILELDMRPPRLFVPESGGDAAGKPSPGGGGSTPADAEQKHAPQS